MASGVVSLELLILILLLLAIIWQRKTSQRIARIEGELARLQAGLAGAGTPAGEELAAVLAQTSETTDQFQPAQAEPAAPSAEPEDADIEPLPAAIPASDKGRDTFESNLGARWAVWVGGVALALGGIFLIDR